MQPGQRFTVQFDPQSWCGGNRLGLRVMAHGKHYFTDKPPMTPLGQLAQVRATAARTGRKYAVYFSERLVVSADKEVQHGRVVHVLGMGPHRVNAPSRPA